MSVSPLEISGRTHDTQHAFLPFVREGDGLVVASNCLIDLVFVQMGIALEVELQAVGGGLVDADPELGGEDVVDLCECDREGCVCIVGWKEGWCKTMSDGPQK